MNSQISVKDKTGLGYDSHVNQGEVLDNVFESVFESDRDDNQVIDRFKKGEGYHAVSLPYTGNFMPPRADLSCVGFDDSVFRSTVSETITSVRSIETNASKSSKDSLQEPKTVRSSAPLIEEWESDSKDENVFKPKEVNKTVKPSFEKIEFVNDKNTTVQKPRNFSQSPRSNKRNWNGLMTQKLWDSFDIKKKACFLNEILTKFGQVPVNAAKQSSNRVVVLVSAARRVNTAAPRLNVNDALQTTYSYFKAHSLVRRPFNQKSAAKTNNFNKRNNTARVNNITTAEQKAVVRTTKGNRDNGVNGCSRHMTGNKFYLSDHQEINGGFVAFGGSPKGGKITGKSKIRTGKLDFEDVYFVKELKFNLFSVSQMRDKKNNVLFTDTECVILSLDFKLLDEISVRSINKKTYCLVVIDDFSIFSWVFFLATKDVTPKILKNFIAGIENQIDNKVKTIKCDNRTEFKNKIMNEFCEMKGIRREFSVARTPQQNGVAERKNRTLIEASRTMVLVIKLHNKTPYELFLGRKPALNFMKPFGCPVTILNTLDHLGSKSSEEEVVDDAGKKNGVQDPAKEGDKYGQEKDVKDQEEPLRKQFVQESKRVFGEREAADTNNTNRLNIVSSSVNDDANENSTYRVFTPVSAAGSSYVNLGGSIPVNAATLPNADLPTDPLMPDLEDTVDLQVTRIFSGAYDDEVEGTVADFNNLELTTVVSPIPTTRIHKDHPKDKIIEDPLSAIQTRRMTKTSQEHAMKVWRLVDLPKGKHAIRTKWVYRNKKDERGIVVRNKARLVTQGHTQEEGIDYDEVFAHVARIEAIRLFFAYASFMGFTVYHMDVKSAFLYGTIEEEVYVCQPPSFEDPQFPNKVYKVEKALYGLYQAPKAWYETLSTFLLENRFRRGITDKTLFIKKDKCNILLVQVYVDDIIFGSTKKSLCTEFEGLMHKKFQISSIGELTFFLGLQVMQKDDGIFISQDKYVADILKKFDFSSVKTASTPIETNKALLKDTEAEDVDVYLYRSMIGSLMYLIASRPDIMFAVCAWARFQVTPKISHLHAMKRIFRYLKGQPKLGLWYPCDSPFDLEAFLDSDYARASLDRKFTTGGCQFLGKRLISWQCKKQTVIANSTTEAEYVAAANYYGQVLWIQNQILDYGFNFMNTKIYIDNESIICIVKNLVFYSKNKHIEIRHHFIRDSYEKRLIQVIKIHTNHNVVDLLTKAFDVSSDDFGVKTGSCKVNVARQDLVLLGKS
ncbi:putative ribonuclease H-like domain-containing protein [Tanacetum coccineum]|uniref:Ribonuclease H-like domain-containing protein n=1 Tax=Tanacetum coccineum TaxID=301880 RepID=A0ABQ5C655_9ASTR